MSGGRKRPGWVSEGQRSTQRRRRWAAPKRRSLGTTGPPWISTIGAASSPTSWDGSSSRCSECRPTPTRQLIGWCLLAPRCSDLRMVRSVSRPASCGRQAGRARRTSSIRLLPGPSAAPWGTSATSIPRPTTELVDLIQGQLLPRDEVLHGWVGDPSFGTLRDHAGSSRTGAEMLHAAADWLTWSIARAAVEAVAAMRRPPGSTG